MAPTRLRSDLLAARQFLREERQRIRQQHERGLPSLQVCARLTSTADTVLLRLYDAALGDLGEEEAGQIRSHLALVAHGGYGRRHLAPYSDVDLMLLYEEVDDGLVTQFARRLTQDIFDIGLHLGQSVRKPSEAVQMARSDAQICTSLVESRLVTGPSEMYGRYFALLKGMTDRRGNSLGPAFIEARRQERLKYGETVYVLEPNLKRSRGGLRDLHLLRWLWFLRSGESDPDLLHMQGHLSKFDYRRLTSSTAFLLRVRNDLHFVSDGPQDLLSRAEQMKLAGRLGFRGREGILPVEEFMRDYFRHTNHIWFLAHRVSELSKPKPKMARVLEPVLGRNIEQDYRVGLYEISATHLGRTKLAHRLDEVLRLVDLARLNDRRIAQETWYHVYRSAPELQAKMDPQVTERFLTILANPAQLGELLRRLHELGVLEKVVPDFAHARCLLQFNQYHKFTVDEHCIRAVEEAAAFVQRKDLLGDTYRANTQKSLLHLALLIHDLGKGFEEDHSEVGMRIARRIGQRLRLNRHDAELLQFLVERHLQMSHLAFRRDTSDLATLTHFARQVGTLERLSLLYLLTCADLAAVGPGVLNDWKVEVLTDLFHRTRQELEATPRPPVQERRGAMRTAVWQLLRPEQREKSWYKEQFHRLPEGFLANHSPAGVVEVLERLEKLAPREGTAWGQFHPESKTVEFTAGVAQGSGRGIFSSMAGALSSFGMQILTADTVVLEHDLLMLRYLVQDTEYQNAPPAERINEIAQAMVASIDGEQPPKLRRIWGHEQRQASAALSNLPNEVRIDTELSGDCAIVEVFTLDRLGLLYDLARAVHDLGLVIRVAKIGTYLDQVVDVFYVTERDGTKPVDSGRLTEICDRLTSIIEPGGGEGSGSPSP